MKTINLKGKEYAPVSERIAQFHKDNKDNDINTSYDFREGYCIFKAELIIYKKEGLVATYTGHAFGEVGKEKAFEKLESVAVGRALAMAGYLAGGEIASYEEMEKWQGKEEVEQTKEEVKPLSEVEFGKLRNGYLKEKTMSPELREMWERCNHEQKKRINDVTKQIRAERDKANNNEQ